MIHVLCDFVMGPPPDGTFDVDSDMGPNWEIDTDHVDIIGSEVDTAESELFDGQRRMARLAILPRPSDGRTMSSKCCWFIGMDVGYVQRVDFH